MSKARKTCRCRDGSLVQRFELHPIILMLVVAAVPCSGRAAFEGDYNVPATRVILLMFLLVGVSACNNAARREQQIKALASDANMLIKQDTDITHQWVNEFVKAFTQENRSKFPANRAFLRTHAEQIIKLVDESSRLNNSAADKYEQAASLSSNEQQRKGLRLFVSAFRKTVEANEMIKSQMQSVSDETLVDAKVFNDRLKRSWELIGQKQAEGQQQIEEGRRLLGW